MIKNNKILTSRKKNLFIILSLTSYLFASSSDNSNNKAREIIDSVCYACHGENMQQSCYGVTKIPNTLSSKNIYKTLIAYKQHNKNEYSMGRVMSQQVEKLSIEELKALSEYIPTLR